MQRQNGVVFERGAAMKMLIYSAIGLVVVVLGIGWAAMPFIFWYGNPYFNTIQAIFLVGALPFGVVVGIPIAIFLDAKGLV